MAANAAKCEVLIFGGATRERKRLMEAEYRNYRSQGVSLYELDYHAAYARFVRANRNKEAFVQGFPDWMNNEDQRRAWNLTYIVGNDLQNLTATLEDARGVLNTMEKRIQAQLQQLEGAGSLPAKTQIDDLSPCIMKKIYPSQFPDQPAVSLLLRLRGDVANPADWPPPSTEGTPEPPTGKGPEVVAAFISRAQQCASVAPLELVVMLSGPSVPLQATTWAWQSWQSDGFVVPILDTLDREAHALNRLVSVARGSVLVALRGDRSNVDDLLTGFLDCSWLQRIVTLYHRIPALGAMTHGRFAFAYPSGRPRLLGPSPEGEGPFKNNMFFREAMTSIPFQYAMYGDYMPMSFSSYLRLDLCLRLWKSGWRVGAHDAGLLQEPMPEVGPALNSDTTRCSPDVAKLAARLVEARHVQPAAEAGDAAAEGPALQALAMRVRELNMQKLQPLGSDSLEQCPMEQGCISM
ncbi:hypothetical protein VOLCADRAFT_95430 [Volvox carteri f. nagariensis]|uniref:Uncharacterized protein n=1 Tax=Volvox carteri f. nagariensis TaxID=3068 RepID=D8U7F5_VOLCA|nr:uncharacterized protein VOLCADRAFT_95430 [Volvox carteri f. nagariensis]EFJ44226.1 hypothetical protein VOLCADRAFT_95430 [Volvox carteri f. nagariensis]|eukprot:XP_002954585.1 hypothetical protein VOLCADRAFT_95430 [Volvox carteri f. nagariensis]